MKNPLKTLAVLLFFFLFFFQNSYAQDWKKLVKDNIKTDKIKDKVKIDIPDFLDPAASRYWSKTEQYIGKKFKAQWKETVTNFSQSYDVTDFNYAISFGDNSTPYEAKGGLKQAKSFAYYLADPTNVTNIPPKIKGQNYNYTGEILYVSSSYKMSEKSFLKANKIYEKERMTDSTFATLTLSNLGLLYHTTGRYTLAEEYTLKALEKRENTVYESV